MNTDQLWMDVRARFADTMEGKGDCPSSSACSHRNRENLLRNERKEHTSNKDAIRELHYDREERKSLERRGLREHHNHTETLREGK